MFVKFCGGLVSHNSGFLGPFYSLEELQDSFCKGTSAIFVYNSVPCSSTTFKSLEGGGADSTGKEGCRDCERYHLSGFLQPDFLSEEENWPISSHYRPIIAQQNETGTVAQW